MMRFTCLVALVVTTFSLNAQVFDPNDPLVDYDELNPPSLPAYGTPAKWVRTKRVSWNSDNYKSYIYNGVPFRMRYPNNYDPNASYPLIVMLHGRGEAGSIYDNENNLKHAARDHDSDMDRGYYNGFIIFPQNTDGYWSDAHMAGVHNLINNELFAIGVDPDRVVFHGLSAGGQGVWRYIEQYPQQVAAAIPMSAASVNLVETVDIYKHIPIWLSQGGRDRAPTPFSSSYLRDEVAAKGGNIRYTLYHNLGHGVWNTHYNESDFWPYILRANRSNPVVLSGELALVATSSTKDVYEFIGKNEICPGDEISVTMGITAGFEAYEWRKDGVLIDGAIGNEFTATSFGTYDVRFRENGVWNDWSPEPIVVSEKQATETPDIVVNGLNSKVIPAPDGSTSVPLELPEGFVQYQWSLEGSSDVLSTERIFNASAPGNYVAVVQEQFGCASNFSAPFTVIDAAGGQQPNTVSNFIGFALSKTSVNLQWAVNASADPATNYEIYRSTASGSGYSLIAITDAATFSYDDTDLDPNTDYFYIVRPVNEFSAAPNSAEIVVRTQVDSNAPTAPTNLQVTGTGSTYLSVSWDAATDDVGVSKYEVFKDGVRSIIVEGTSATLFNLTEGESYQVSVKARDLTGNLSAFSNIVVGTAAASGINYKFYAKDWSENYLVDLNTKTPLSSGNLPNFDISVREFDYNYVFLFSGEINIPVAGSYTFETRSDDGSKLYIGGYSEDNLVVNNDGNHGMRYREGTITFDEPGFYPIDVAFYQEGGGQGLQVYWKNTAHGVTSRQLIPDEAFEAQIVLGGDPPASPTDIVAQSISFDQIDVSWVDNSADETGFQLYRATSSMGPFVPVTLTAADVTSYSDAGLAPDTEYFYQVLAIGEHGPSGVASAAITNIGDVNSGIAALDNASGIGYILFSERNVFERFSSNRPNSSNSDHLIAVKRINDEWFYDNNSNYYPLQIEEGDVLLAEVDFSADQITSLEGVPSIVHGIEAGFESGDLTFFANRWNGGNNGGEFTINGTYFNRYNKPIASATTTSLPNPPAAVADFSLGSVEDSSVELSWSSVADADAYTLSRALDGINFLQVEAFAAGDATYSYTDTGLEPHTDYQYQLVATNAGGNSEVSDVSTTTLNNNPELADLPSTLVIRFDTEFDLQISVSDDDGDSPSISGSNLPSFATVVDYEDGTGLLQFAPAESDQGTYTSITVTAADGFGGTVNHVLDLTVNSNNPPGLSAIGNVSTGEGSIAVASVTATDVEGVGNLNWSFDLPSFVTPTVNLDGTADMSVAPGYADAGSYTGGVTIEDQEGATATSSFTITVSDVDPNTTVKINFTAGTFQGDASWNNTSGHPQMGDTYPNLIDDEGAATSIGVSINSNWTNNGSNNSGTSTGNNSGVLPDNVMISAYWTYTNPEEVLLSGLDDSKQYKLGFFGSRNASDNRTTQYTVGGQSTTLNAASNTSEMVYLTTQPTNGELSIEVNKGSGSTFGYINALIVEELYGADLTPDAPNNLVASFSSADNAVNVSWNERAYNEDGYRVYRSQSLSEAYEILADLPAGSASYMDTEVAANSDYYYRIGSYNGNGESFSSEVLVSIPNVNPQLDDIADVVMTASQDVSVDIVASDDAGDVVALSATGLPGFAALIDNGDGTGRIDLDPQSSDVGTYQVTVTADDDKGGSSSVDFTIDVTADGLHHYYINMAGTTAFLEASPWNNYVGGGAANSTLNNITAAEAGHNDISMRFVDAWEGYNTSGMTGSSILPDKVTRASVWVSTTQAKEIVLTGLDLGSAYDVSFFASRNGSGDRTTVYTINGTSVSLDASYNTDNLATIAGVIPNASGEISISAQKANSASYGYINAIILTGYEASASLANPTNLVASPVDEATISLSWIDNSNQETGYEVWTSLDSQTGFSLLTTTGADVGSYTHSSVSAGVTHYYKVRAAFGDGSFSDYSNVTGTSTINSVVGINFNVTDPAAAPWNNTNSFPDPGLVFNNLNDQNSNNTGIAFEIVESNPGSGVDPSLYGFSGDNPFGMNTGNDSGVVPDNVMRSTYWMDAGRLAELRFFNLDLTQKYSFKFFASRNGGGDRTTVYTINGESVSLNASYNVNNIVEIQNIVPDENGEIWISITSGPFASYSYLGGMIISSSNYVEDTSNARLASSNEVVETNELSEELDTRLLLYPNPYRNGILRMMLEGSVDEALSIEVIDINGRVVLGQSSDFYNGSGYVELQDVDRLSAGIYVVRIKGQSLGVKSIRLIKE